MALELRPFSPTTHSTTPAAPCFRIRNVPCFLNLMQIRSIAIAMERICPNLFLCQI
ncbi:hypothetical protein L3Y34_014149 [Caenorhabditis briggsae]|uniref:Uncharacterized protein n=1 Tax=Caenorhabditis briggsae TaxID=6238 RepID=A0AAE9IWZ0_CAEBR|nr:hypothetical protein L3Y34_014149 [Caenorhabditis briggsae]